jgi:hypothetical protein
MKHSNAIGGENVKTRSRFYRGGQVRGWATGVGLIVAALGVLATSTVWADVTLVEDGKPHCVIIVSPNVMSPKAGGLAREPEQQRQRLRESVTDLALYLRKMSGADVPIVTDDSKAIDGAVAIYIGDMATKAFGPVGKTFPYQQAFRVVVTSSNPAGKATAGAVGLMGESDLATSYAIYETLDRLGCRWYLPSPMGEFIPELKTIRLPEMDLKTNPATIFRGTTPADVAFQRRNRIGGMPSSCNFGSLESHVSADLRRQHPDWLASNPAHPQVKALVWSKPEVAAAIAESILATLARTPQPTVSLFTFYGGDVDQSPESLALDTGDYDPTFQAPSVTDRMLVLVNRVAAAVAAKSPDTLLLMSAYATSLRAPLREHPAPNIVPVIVASAYDRAHPLTDDATPGNTDLRHAIQGWGKVSHMIANYAYTYNLSEPTAPNPMIARVSSDVPFYLKNKCMFWIPESPANWEAGLPGLYLTVRLTFNPSQDPSAIIDRFMTEFYGHAAKEMHAYWRLMDDAWTKTPVYAGCSWSYTRRFSPKVLAHARKTMDAAKAACQTPAETARVEMADLSLTQLELFMKLRCDLNDGRWDALTKDVGHWQDQATALSKRFAAQGAFAIDGVGFFKSTLGATYKDAARIAASARVLTPQPLHQWRYLTDPKNQGEAAGWSKPDWDDHAWKTTDPCIQTWGDMDCYHYFGPMWYRTTVDLSQHKPEPGKKVCLWLANAAGATQVYVNGTRVKYIKTTVQPDKTLKSELADTFIGTCTGPANFDVTDAIRPGSNQITIRCDRQDLDELGVGGLIGPVVLYSEK